MGQDAIIGIATVAVAVLGAAVLADKLAGRDPLHCEERQHATRYTYSTPDRRAVEPAYQTPDCNAPKNEKEDDLCAQRRMAYAAEQAECIARWQAWISAFGLGGLLLTIIYAARSARAAGAAAHAAHRSARSASETVGQMRENAERELRAYVCYIGGNVVNFDTDSPVMQAVFKNCGQTPAYNVTLLTTARVAEFPLTSELTLRPDAETRSFGVVGPGIDVHFRLPLDDPPLPYEQKQWIKAGVSALYLFGQVTYRDTFGAECWTTFRVMLKGDAGFSDPEMSLATCDEGNNADR